MVNLFLNLSRKVIHKSCFQFTANEICDRFAATGFQANLITYLTQQLNMPLVKASNTLTNFNGFASFMPIIGALVADSFLGRYWTIIIGLLIYEMVHFSPIHTTNLYINEIFIVS